MDIQNLKPLAIKLTISLIIVISLTTAYQFGGMRQIENLIADAIVTSLTDKDKAGKKVVYVMTSQRSLNEMNDPKTYNMGYPWRRAIYTKVINYLNLADAKVIAFDALYSERSAYRRDDDHDDEIYSQSLKENKNVVIGFEFGTSIQKFEGKVQKIMNKLSKNPVPKEKIGVKFFKRDLLNKLPNKLEKDFILSIYRRDDKKKIYILKDNITSEEQSKIANILKSLNYRYLQKVAAFFTGKKEDHFKGLQKKDILFKIEKAYRKKELDKLRKKSKALDERFAIPLKNPDHDNRLQKYYHAQLPIKIYMNTVYSIASLSSHIDKEDNTIRRTPLLTNFFGNYYPSLSMSVLKIYLKAENLILKGNQLYLKDKIIPLDQNGFFRLKYYGTNDVYEDYYDIDLIRLYDQINKAYKKYKGLKDVPLIQYKELFQGTKDIKGSEVIEKMLGVLKVKAPKVYESFPKKLVKKVAPEKFRGKIILYGAIAAGLKDLRPTPFLETEAGVHVHATVIDNVLNNDYLIEVRESNTNILLIVILGLLTAYLVHRLSILWGTLSSILLLILLIGSSIVLYKYKVLGNSVLFDPVTPAISVLLNFIAIFGINFFKESKQKRYIEGAFGQYLSPHIIEIIKNDPSKLRLGGEEKEITAFFSDIGGFSTISEQLKPQELVQLLNEYLTDMCNIIAKHDGTVDKFEGDAIISFWGAPLEEKDHAKLACYTTIEMQESLKELNKKWKAEDRHPLVYNMSMRIGLCSGLAVVGNMGSESRMDYTMMGDTVNLAARLEAANKFYGTYSMISDSTYEQTKDYIDVRELDTIRVVGREAPVIVYELLSKKGQTSEEMAEGLNDYLKGLELYKNQDFSKAISKFKRVLKEIPGDPPSQTYIERCREYIENPPDEDWDGVTRLTSKG